MAAMHTPSYWPEHSDRNPCWQCHHFGAMVYAGTAARCFIGNRTRIEAAPARGCAFWQREPGTDDEPGPPMVDCVPPVLAGLPGVAPAVEWAP